MKRLLKVREFDKITNNPDYSSFYKYLPEKQFQNLEQFIRVFSGDDEYADALEFMKIGYRRNIGDIISVNNYVGLIQMQDGFQIEILPKIEYADDYETKRVFLRMLKSMKDFPSKVFNDSDLHTDDMNLYEIFIQLYLREADSLVKHGLKSSYNAMEDNLKYFKGKLLVSNHVSNNHAHKERFYVRYDEYNVNRPENRLIKSTLLKLQGVTDSPANAKHIRQLLASFEVVEPSVNYEKDLSSYTLDRNSKIYETLIQWSRIILMNESFTTFSGSNNARALLFPMERLFESYVAKEIRKGFAGEDCTITTQDNKYHLFDTPCPKFALRPDIVLEKEDGSFVIFDTKWKQLIDNSGKNYGISQADMYQLYAYAKKYRTSEVFLIYPLNEQMKSERIIRFSSDDNVNVNVFLIDLMHIEEDINILRENVIP